MYSVIHQTSRSGLSFVISSHGTRERAERRARRLADQVVRLYGGTPRAERYDRWERLGEQLTTGYGVVVDRGEGEMRVAFNVVGTDDCGDSLSYSRHIEGS